MAWLTAITTVYTGLDARVKPGDDFELPDSEAEVVVAGGFARYKASAPAAVEEQAPAAAPAVEPAPTPAEQPKPAAAAHGRKSKAKAADNAG